MSSPILRASTESGATWDDPSEDLLFELLSDVERGDERFIVVERLGDPTGQTYAQSIRNDDGSYLVERREGHRDAHFQHTASTIREAHSLLTAWAYELPGLDGQVDWGSGIPVELSRRQNGDSRAGRLTRRRHGPST
jgi:hypothetical protein